MKDDTIADVVEPFLATHVVRKDVDGPGYYLVRREECVTWTIFQLTIKLMRERFVDQYEQLRRSVAPLERIAKIVTEPSSYECEKMADIGLDGFDTNGVLAVLAAVRALAEASQ